MRFDTNEVRFILMSKFDTSEVDMIQMGFIWY